MIGILGDFTTIDITDKTLLEQQLNFSREKYYECLGEYENLGKKISRLKEDNSDLATSIYASCTSSQMANLEIKKNDEYQRRLVEIEALESGQKILEEKMNFVKSDLRILQNSMYTKF